MVRIVSVPGNFCFCFLFSAFKSQFLWVLEVEIHLLSCHQMWPSLSLRIAGRVTRVNLFWHVLSPLFSAWDTFSSHFLFSILKLQKL